MLNLSAVGGILSTGVSFINKYWSFGKMDRRFFHCNTASGHCDKLAASAEWHHLIQLF